MDLATLGIKVETQGAQQATTQLNQLDTAGKKVEQQAAKTSKAYQQTALSAKQLQAAQRQLPMQFTDIAVGLSSGQKPLQVLLQQGGQLKDVFGGVGPALRGMAGYVMSLVNPVTLLAGAFIGLSVAWSQAEERSHAINRALILTGQYTEQEAERLREYSRELDNLSGVTAGSAAKAIAEVTAVGTYTGDTFDKITKAAVMMQAATGQSIQDTLQQFDKLRRGGVDTALEITRANRFLTQSTLDQVQSLREQGREAEATNVLLNALADDMISKAPRMAAEVGTLTTAFKGLKIAASETWDAVVEGLERAADRLRKESIGPFGNALRYLSGKAGANGAVAADPTAAMLRPLGDRPVDADQAKADQDWQKNAIRYATEREKLERDIAEARKLGTAAGKSEEEIQKRIAAIQAEHARRNRGRAGGGAGAVDNAGFRAQIQSVQDALRLEQNAIQNANSVLQAQYSARLVSVQDYYSQQRGLVEQASRAEEAAIEQQIAVLRTKTKTEKDAIDSRREIGQLEAQLAMVRADLTAKQAVLDIQEKANLDRKRQALKAYTDALGRSNEALADQMRNEVNRVFMSEREFAIQSRLNDIYRERADRERELATQLANREITQGEYDDYLDALAASTDAAVQIVRNGYDAMAAAQADWQNGAVKALKDYADEAADVAGQVYNIMSDAFRGLEDVAVDFFTKGSADWKGFLDQINADIMRFIVRQQLSKWFESLAGGLNNSGGSGWASILGSLFGGARATGGDVDPRKAYLVGEKGPELFVPGQVGHVTSAEQTRRLGRGILNAAAGSAPQMATSGPQTFNFNVSGSIDRRSAYRIALDANRDIRTAGARA